MQILSKKSRQPTVGRQCSTSHFGSTLAAYPSPPSRLKMRRKVRAFRHWGATTVAQGQDSRLYLYIS